jgi:hypothetical protein
MDKLDGARMFRGEADIMEALKQTYDNLVKGKPLDVPVDELLAIRAPDIAKQASQHRQVHFKDADSWMAYNDRFGSKSLGEAAFAGLDRAARQISLMETFGPEPEAMYATIKNDLLRAADPDNEKTVKGLKGNTASGKALDVYFDQITGKTDVPASYAWAKAGRAWRTLNSLSKLGLATISAITDVATKAAAFSHNGIGFLESYSSQIGQILEGRSSGWKREFADIVGAGIEGTLGDVHARFSTGDELPGAMTKAMQFFFKINGLNWWTDSGKTGAFLMLSHNLGRNAEKGFGELPEKLARSLSLYGIDEAKWNVLRSLAGAGEDGRAHLSPEGIANLPDDAIKSAYNNQKASPREVRRMKDELETALRAYYTDQIDYAVLTPGAAEAAVARLGTAPGTPLGEAVRLVMQFKQFSITATTKGLGKAMYGGGANSIREAIFKRKADMLGLVHLGVMGTAMAYVAMAAKDIVKGKTPRDPTSPATWAAAFTQGGGAGIYGDFFFGEFSRFGTSALAALSGPALGQSEQLFELWSRFREGDDAAGRTVKFVINNSPFINLPYTRIGMDYLFLYGFSEAMNPGYLRRMERRAAKENNQTYLFPPSSYARRF